MYLFFGGGHHSIYNIWYQWEAKEIPHLQGGTSIGGP